MKHLFFVCAVLLFFSCSKSEENTVAKPESPTTENPEKENPEQPEQPDNQLDPTLVIESVSPQIVDLGDTLSLKGENFNKDVRLSIGQSQLKILFNNDSIIEFELPYWGFEPDSLHISVDNRDTIANYRNAFQLYQPEIDSIPSNFGYRDTVVVYGKHLINRPDINDGIVELNNDRLTVIDHSKDSIRFVLPYNVDKHENDLLVRAQLRTLRKDQGVVIPDPIITAISKDSLVINENITIYGSNFFGFRDYLHEVYIGENRAEVIGVYNDSIVVNVPLGPYRDRHINDVVIKVVEKEATKDLGLYLKNTWYLHGYKRTGEISRTAGAGQISGESFYYDNAMYFSVYDYIDGFENSSSSNYRLYKYYPDSNVWEQQSDLPVFSDVGRSESIQLFPIGNGELYIYIDREVDNFYKYNLNTEVLLELNDFNPGFRVGEAIGFVQGDNFYFGAGYAREFDRSSYIRNNKFWKYSQTMGSWSEISAIPEVPGQYEYAYYSNHFEKDGKIYICNGDRAYETWEFTPDETWVRKADLVNPINQTIYTQIGDKGYFYHYGDRLFYEYDLTNDEWIRKEGLKIEGYNPQRETMFVHNGYVYLVGWQSGYPPDYSGFFNLDQIILRTELSNFTD